MDTVEFWDELAVVGNQKPRANALSPTMLARVIYQPSFLYFRAVAEDLSVRSASRKLGVASSAITRQVAQLENALGVDLFHRISQRLSLTAAGRILLHHTKQVLKPLEAAVSDLEGLRRQTAGAVSIAAVESIGFSLMPDLLSGFGDSHPRFRTSVTLEASSRVLSHVAMNEADIGITVFVGVPDGVKIALERTLSFGAVMSPTHPLTEKHAISLDDLTPYPCAVVVDGLADEVGLLARVALERSGLFKPMIQANSVQIPIGLARLGDYVALVTPLPVRHELDRGTLAFRPFVDPDLAKVRVGLFIREGQPLSPAAAAFLSYAVSYFRAAWPTDDDLAP